jgi:hypothetical protein
MKNQISLTKEKILYNKIRIKNNNTTVNNKN